MKWRARALALALCAILALPQMAFAAEGDEHTFGVTGVSAENGYSITMLEDDDTVATAYSGFVGGSTATYTVYDEVAKMKLSFAGESDQQYMVFLLQGDTTTVPTENNLCYIDQGTGSDTTEFIIYPDSIEAADTYTIYVSSTEDEYAEAGSFTVVESWTEAGYTLGDVDSSGVININDALAVMQHIVGIATLDSTQQQAANTVADENNAININDALAIMQYIVGIIEGF